MTTRRPALGAALGGASVPSLGPSPGPSHGSQRRLRVGEEIRHRLAEIFLRAPFRDPDLAAAQLTVTEVRVSPDLRHATAYVARLGRSDIAALMPALTRATPFLQSEVVHGLRLRRAPTLTFAADTTLDQANRIEAVLRLPTVARDLANS
ncbi:MAG TPA: 30S ribosome-binding factor RbfA [Acetobacteraceae bacterium]|nr:30S ribosome-binding factor RbfA [Acetobacteraceae bacterium]